MQKKILFLGASRYYQKSIESIKRYGYNVLVIDRNSNSPGFKSADKFAAIDITDEENACRFAMENKINGVLAINDFGVRTAAYISQEMGLNGLSYEAAKIVTDKALMRKKWAENDVPVPKFFVTEIFEEARKKIKELTFPVILKPADSRGGASRGVKVIFREEKLLEAFKFAQSF